MFLKFLGIMITYKCSIFQGSADYQRTTGKHFLRGVLPELICIAFYSHESIKMRLLKDSYFRCVIRLHAHVSST